MRTNIVLHYQGGTSDKVYIVSVKQTGSGRYDVIAKWGRRERAVLARQVKGSFADELTAQNYLGDLINEKIGKGYVDIESGQYDGSLTVNSPEIVPHLEMKSGPSKGKSLAEVFEKEAANVDVRRAEELVCLDNTGIEDRFDKNISYVCEPHIDARFVYVYDKFGNKSSFLIERFGLLGWAK